MNGVDLLTEVKMIKDDLRIFTSTSEKPYDRHKYKIIFKNGKSVILEDYQTMKNMWYQWRNEISNVEVLDEGGKGF